jgi:lipopolysaccharide export system permease protein
MNRIDRFILSRLFAITALVLIGLILIFIIIDFSENSDDFTDRGAPLSEIWWVYYYNYIPEIIRLVLPVAVFVSALLVVSKMAQKMEITAMKAAGISLYRYMWPFLLFAIACTGLVSYMDGYIVPEANKARIGFERQYIMTRSDRVDRNKIYRQESANTLLIVNYYAPTESIAYRVQLLSFEDERITHSMEASRMEWDSTSTKWIVHNAVFRVYNERGFDMHRESLIDTTLSILPRDLARTTSDIYQLTYPEIVDYIASMERVGAGDVELPKVQFYGKLFYSFSVIVVMILGVSIASVRRPGGTGFVLGLGLAVSFLYLAFMKLIEPFGAAGVIDPLWAASIPHISFFTIAIILLLKTPK